ncbi:hypothetical protein LOK49_LG03G02964 [Camellia lanceoleosa]|uniref:Uncharacterized protein n=1 Tax=Camellia lanceoleosa TaxID=1840588 RepID=A0ACC0IGX2_9ERIC|nr:hypothetical protein LOK49_LG03G02964 [Camellia lanceoleosa]
MDSCYLSEKKTSRGDGGKLLKNCNYYSEMNEEERNEKLISAIRYCKDSKCRVVNHQSRLHDAAEILKYENLEVPSCDWRVLGTRIMRDRRPCVRVKKTMG